MFGVFIPYKGSKHYKTHIILCLLWIVGGLKVMAEEEKNKYLEREPHISTAQ